MKYIGKVAGTFYLAFILLSIIADVIGHLGFGTADTIIKTLISNPFLFRISFLISLLSAFFFFLAAWALYVLLKPVNKNLAMLFLLLNLIGITIQCAGMLPLYAAMLSAGNISMETYLFVDVFRISTVISQLFFGAWLLPLGYLVYKSKFLPKILGIIILIHFIGWMLTFFQLFLFPDFVVLHKLTYPLGFVSEFGLTLWLLIK